MTDDELLAIDALAEAATQGPWHLATACCDDDENFSNVEAGHTDIASDVPNADAVFIVAARMDVPALVKEVRRLRRHSEALKKLLALNSVRVEPQSEADADAAAVLQTALRSDDMVDDVLEMYVNSVVKMCRQT